MLRPNANAKETVTGISFVLIGLVLGMILSFLVSGCGKAPQPGPQGQPGVAGKDGLAGQPGAPCVTLDVPGGVEVDCPGSAPVTVKNGGDGAKGKDGLDGAPGTITSVVQFCSQYTAVYPSSFPEVGLCIGGSLYGVYYTPGYVFLSLLPPGAYSSTSPQGCSFTIATNCQVTP